MRDDAPEVKERLQRNVQALLDKLCPDGEVRGPYWFALNPTRADRSLGSFRVRLHGEKAGAWADEATGDGASINPNGRWKGDVFGLIGYCNALPEFRDQIAWARKWLGTGDVPPVRLSPAERQVRERARAAEAAASVARDEVERAANRKKALAGWLRASPELLGTLADVYLRQARGVDLRLLERMPDAVRFDPSVWHREAGGRYPCIVSMMTGPDGKLWAAHRVFLRPDGLDKIDVDPPRKIWPRGFAGAAIRLARGQSGMSIREAAEHGIADTLVLTEGIEDGLSVALACPEVRVWAAGNLGNLASISVPQCCTDVIVFADNDWGRPEAAAQLETAIGALMPQGKSVRIARSSIGKDANDCLRAAASWG